MGKTRREGRVRIERLTHEGRGIGHVEGRVVFVDFALPGETADFYYTRQKGKWDEGVAFAIEGETSSDRAEPPCPHFTVCGGCSLQHMHPEAQLALKEKTLLEQLAHFSHVEPRHVLPPLLTVEPWHYRHRARLGVNWIVKKEILMMGFRERGGRYLQNVPGCRVLHERLMNIFPELHALIQTLSIKQQIPQIEVLISDGDLALCIRHLKAFSEEDLVLLKQFEATTGFRFYLQPQGPDSIHALLEPAPCLFYELDEKRLRIYFSPTDFTQVNFALNRQMVQRAMELLAPQSGDRILDLFCGLGNFTLPMALRGAFALGVEGEEAMVQKARLNAASNGLSEKAVFEAANLFGPFGEVGDWLSQARQGHFNKILLDPPRLGALEVLQELKPAFLKGYFERVMYVSCHPATLARDVGFLVHECGMTLESAGVMDMFPHTQHVESIAVLVHEKGEKK